MELLIIGGVLFCSSNWIMNLSCFTTERNMCLQLQRVYELHFLHPSPHENTEKSLPVLEMAGQKI